MQNSKIFFEVLAFKSYRFDLTSLSCTCLRDAHKIRLRNVHIHVYESCISHALFRNILIFVKLKILSKIVHFI